jgi:hypothetical protein
MNQVQETTVSTSCDSLAMGPLGVVVWLLKSKSEEPCLLIVHTAIYILV